MRKRYIVGMSGGVDSAVAALLLKQQGHEVVGLFMKNWEDDDTEEYCSARTDLLDAVAAADRIGIDIETVNFSVDYKQRVFAEFLDEYRNGRTPNPDVLCNAEIKFRAFLDHALGLGADMIATGHYARTFQAADGNTELHRAADRSKDQSYFLYRLSQAQLSRTAFPLGDLRKSEVRRIARSHQLSVHDKRDSTGICFIGERPFRQFLGRYLPAQPGEIQTPEGERVGTHSGLMFYTIGQRQGLGIGGRTAGDGRAWYVVDKDLERNRLVVAQGHDHPKLFASALTCTRLSWVLGAPPDPRGVYSARIRYRQQDEPCSVTMLARERCALKFERAQWAITPGQSAVVYAGETCLGGGIIERAHTHDEATSLTLLGCTG